jgi:coenzyme A diphosphatase NUDT7
MKQATKTAVLIPLVEVSGRTEVLFEVRAQTLKRQPGEISFPGGHEEERDPDMAHTALRETSEELGVSISDIRMLGPLDLFVAHSGLIVYPFVGKLLTYPRLDPNPGEVAEVFTVGLEQLLAMQPASHKVNLRPEPAPDFPFHWIPGGKDYPWRMGVSEQFFYPANGRIIWGMTARILHHFLEIAGQI